MLINQEKALLINKEKVNKPIEAQIQALELSQNRPLREVSIDTTNSYAVAKIADIDAQIVALRQQLI